jgi:chromosome segregation ATPase
MKPVGKATGPAGFKASNQSSKPAVVKSKPIAKESNVTKGVNKNQPLESTPKVVLHTDKKPDELYYELEELTRNFQEMENMSKNQATEINKYDTELTNERQNNSYIRSEIKRLEQEKKELEEKLSECIDNHDHTKEQLRDTEDILSEKEKYIKVLVNENDGFIQYQEQKQIFEVLPNRDDVKRPSVITTRDSVKRNSIATTTIKQFQQANNIA